MKPYVPESLPLQNLDHARLIGLVGQANAELARYDGLLQGIVNPAVMLSPLTNQEAVLSSKIEGTQATLEEVLEHEAGQVFPDDRAQDIREIGNYRTALVLASEVIAERPISLQLLRQMHEALMNSVRGRDKTPGEFRRDQNWIGRPGCLVEEATFIPPNPLQLLDHLQAWEAYLTHQEFDALVQAAIMHAQFELIHPFKDGNGRIGRALIPLFLYQKRALASPMFYLSAYLEAHREVYYDRLRSISEDRDWNSWIVFFLEAIIAQARDNAKRVKEILALYKEMKQRIRDITRSQYTVQVLDALFERPIFQTSIFIERSGIPNKVTANSLLRQLRNAEIIGCLREASGQRPGIYTFPALLNIAEGRDAF